MENSKARKQMIDSQIYTNKVEDEFVLAALETVPREEFVPEKLRGVAYIDEDLNLGEGRFLIEPMVFARMLQLANFKKDEKVLVVASASGYPVAVIAALAGQVVGLENNINFISSAQSSLKKLGIDNVSFVKAELDKGAERHKPFDAIFINGALENIPAKLYSQLNEGGRLIAVKAEPGHYGPHYVTMYHKNAGVVSEIKAFQAFVPKLTEFNSKPGFKF